MAPTIRLLDAELDCEQTARGLSLAGDASLGPAITLVNGIADASLLGYDEALETGQDVDAGPVQLRRRGKGKVAISVGGQSVELPVVSVLEAVDALLTARYGEGPWLFADAPVAGRASVGAETAMRSLENRASELDRGGGAATERRSLLQDLEAAGLFSEAHAAERLRYLRRWGASTLVGYQVASAAAWSYYAGDQRRDELGQAVPSRLLGGSLSIDWFRRPPPVPDGWTRDRLCISSEATLATARSGGQLRADAGSYYWSSGRIRGEYVYRCDLMGTRSLVTASVELR